MDINVTYAASHWGGISNNSKLKTKNYEKDFSNGYAGPCSGSMQQRE
jgi:hypothetical protein